MKDGFDRIFSIDNPFFTIMTKLFDICLLNVLWLVCCLPIITVGSATQAMYYVALKIAEDHEGKIIRSYFTAFRTGFRQSMTLGLIYLGGTVLLLGEIVLCHLSGTTFYFGLMAVFMILLLG